MWRKAFFEFDVLNETISCLHSVNKKGEKSTEVIFSPFMSFLSLSSNLDQRGKDTNDFSSGTTIECLPCESY
jgi:hypothetical protein